MRLKIYLMYMILVGCICLLGVDLTTAQGVRDYTIDSGVEPGEYSMVGKSGFQFLKLPVNARQAAIGGIITSVGRGDASSVLNNPATMSDVNNIAVSSTMMNWIADINYSSASIVKNMAGIGTFGLGFIYVDYGDMVRTQNVELLDELSESTGNVVPQTEGLGTVTGSDLALGLSYSRQITDRLQVGGTLKYVREKLDDAESSNIAFDIGTMYYTGFKSLRVAMLGRNFGPDVEFTEYQGVSGTIPQQVRMPVAFVLGTAIDLLEGLDDNPHLLTLALEAVHPNDADERINVGAEYVLMDMLSLRGGYRYNYDEEGLTAGIGVQLATETMGVRIDYSYLDFGRLDSVNLFSLALFFD